MRNPYAIMICTFTPRLSIFWGLACLVLLPHSAFAMDPNPPSIHSEKGAWPIRRQWTLEETRHFAEWLRHIYAGKTGGSPAQRLAKLERILTDPEMNLLLDPAFAGEACNPQLDLDTIRAMHRVVDCAKLTVALGTYYAYRRGLPWIASRVRAGDGSDVRTADYTVPASEINSFEYDSAGAFFRDATNDTCTGNFRVELNRDRSELSDTLPVAITREHLIPGCLFYMDGHVMILAEVTPYGAPRFLDATVAASRDIYAFNGLNAVYGVKPRQSGSGAQEFSGCYRGFRVFRWPVAEVSETGEVTRVRRRTDEEMRAFGYSAEQYDRIEELFTKQHIMENQVPIGSFHQFIRLRLRSAERADPVADIRAFAGEMLAFCEERERLVQAAWREVNANGPVIFPEDAIEGNVFTAGGRWGENATALTDTAFRARYTELVEDIDNAIIWFDRNANEVIVDELGPYAAWSHTGLANALLRTKNRIFAETPFEYTNSDGQPVRLSLLDIENRMSALSFDPNHPPELRWGAPPGSPEAQSGRNRGTPLPGGSEIAMEEAYRREAYYRSLTHWEPEPSHLRQMFTEGFPVIETLDQTLRRKWFDRPAPPLVPLSDKDNWL